MGIWLLVALNALIPIALLCIGIDLFFFLIMFNFQETVNYQKDFGVIAQISYNAPMRRLAQAGYIRSNMYKESPFPSNHLST